MLAISLLLLTEIMMEAAAKAFTALSGRRSGRSHKTRKVKVSPWLPRKWNVLVLAGT